MMDLISETRDSFPSLNQEDFMKITKNKFKQYLEVQEMGAFNMLDPRAVEFTFLTNEEWRFIIKNYDKYYKKWGGK